MTEGTTGKFGFVERLVLPALMRVGEAVATMIGDSREVEAVIARLPDELRVALDPVITLLGSIPEFTDNHLINDVIRTFANRLGERLRVQVHGGERVTRAGVEADARAAYHEALKRKEKIMADLKGLKVFVPETDDYFMLEGCPKSPAPAKGKGQPRGPRIRQVTLEEAEDVLKIPVHPGCGFCPKVLAFRKEKAGTEAAALDEKLAAAAKPPKKRRSWIEILHEDIPDEARRRTVREAILRKLDLYDGDERAEREALLLLYADSVAELIELAEAPSSRVDADTIFRGMRERTLGAVAANLMDKLGRACGRVGRAVAGPETVAEAGVPPIGQTFATRFGQGWGATDAFVGRMKNRLNK